MGHWAPVVQRAEASRVLVATYCATGQSRCHPLVLWHVGRVPKASLAIQKISDLCALPTFADMRRALAIMDNHSTLASLLDVPPHWDPANRYIDRALGYVLLVETNSGV